MDFVGSIDGTPFAGGEGRDQMVELGSGRLVPGFEEQLEGAGAGEDRTVKVDFPDDYGAERAGRQAGRVRRHGQGDQGQGPARARRRPRRRGRLRHARRAARRHPRAHRRAGRAPGSTPSSARPRWTPRSSAPRSRCPTRWSRRARASCGTRCSTRSRTRGSPRRPTCRSPGASEDEIVEAGKEDAAQALRREAVLAAIVEAEGIEPTEDELLEAVGADGGARARLAEEAARAAEVRRAARRAQGGPRSASAERRDRQPIRRAGAVRDKPWTPAEAENASGGLDVLA